jgi:hypothetical protein
MKPAGWPKYMIPKRLRSGATAYYWNPPARDLANGFPLPREPLGRDYGAAVQRANLLNGHLCAWRSGKGGVPNEHTRRGYGTVAWLFEQYRRSPAFEKRVSKRSRYEYERALNRIEDIRTKDGRLIAELPVSSITQLAVDKIYEKLQDGPRGKRKRQANLSIDIAARAWDVVHRRHPSVFPIENPWRGVLKDLTKATKPAASREEAYALANALRDIGEPHLGAVALICFEWHMRPENVLSGKITWGDYRSADRPNMVRIAHHKTGEIVWQPLGDIDDPFYPDIEAYLSSLPRLGLPIVLTTGAKGASRPYSHFYARSLVRKARAAAKLASHVTFDACRHGGMTELGDAEITEQGVMSLSGHKTPEAARGYVKRTELQREIAARKRRAFVEANETGARVRIEPQRESQNGTKAKS